MIILHETELNLSKNLVIALNSLYGIGFKQASYICKKQGFGKTLKVSDLSDEQLDSLHRFLIKYELFLNHELSRIQRQNVKTLVDIKCYRGLRLKKGLPARGQRTRTNANTCLKLRIR